MYNYSKSNNISFLVLYKTIYKVAFEASTMNTNSTLAKAFEDVKMVMEHILESDETPNEIALNTTELGDWKNIAAFEELYKLKQLSQTKNWDWSTEAVGSLFIKTIQYVGFFGYHCEYTSTTHAQNLVHDLFTLPKQSLSLPDITDLYSKNNYRLIEPNMNYGGLHQYLSDCLTDVYTNNSIIMKENVDIGTARYSIEYLQSSPCLDLKKFSRCSKYCIWHQHFFEDIPKSEFLISMTYALPQRKIRLEKTPHWLQYRLLPNIACIAL